MNHFSNDISSIFPVKAAHVQRDNMTLSNAHFDDSQRSLKSAIQDEGVRIYSERGKCLFLQGENVDKFFLIVHGGIALTRQCPDGNTQVLDFFFDGAVFSDIKQAFAPATYSAVCLMDTHAFAISAASLRRNFRHEASLMQDCNQLLIDTLNRAYSSLTNLGCGHGDERVAYVLCMIHDAIADETQRAVTIPLRQIDIANAIGMTPVYVNQILKSLKKYGAINLNKGSIEILDISVLRHICKSHEQL